MHARTSSPKDSLLPLLNELYERIRVIEAEHGLWAGAKDYRPRIDLFHDAVRAYSGGHSPYESTGRLTLERLSWDSDALRAIMANPLLILPGAERGSPSAALVVKRPVAEQRAHERAMRSELGQYYKNYAVLFMALLTETADMNHKGRMDELDALVEELAGLAHASAGKSSVNLHKMADAHIHDGDLQDMAKAALPKETLAADAAKKAIKAAHNKIDAQQAKLEGLHTNWLAGQLEMYEESKTLVQQFMRQGLNMAGKFLQEAMTQGGRGAGGRGF